MIMVLAQITGVLAVVLYFLSYQLKKRNNIITVNAISRVLYVLQYILLGAFEGAVLDLTGMVSSVVARYKEKPFIKKYFILFVIATNVILLIAGLFVYENIFSWFAILGIMFEVTALWITKEKTIRILSLVAAPFWLIYNFMSQAYGSALGNVLTIISIIVAMIRYDFKRNK